MVDQSHKLPVVQQCRLLSLNRSTFYYQPKLVSEVDLRLMRRIDEMHLKRPFYGSRRICVATGYRMKVMMSIVSV